MEKQIVSKLQIAYLNLESAAVESKYEEFSFISRKFKQQQEEEKNGEVALDIFGFRINDEDIPKQF